ncbi:mitochondrial ornithine transporter 1 [[Candida] anglica]|uniref:Mitochondrial thiamine pyrophosphate carrier 1 n=1 Tax=[Candida] anglica TaxID=148631 RepID=A0ABP0E9K7_9ASCO
MALYTEEIALDNIANDSTLDPVNEIMYGAISGMLGKVVEYPFDTIKVRLQSATSTSSLSTYQCIAQTYSNEGIIKGFYQGIKAPLLGACLETSILFASYNFTANIFTKYLQVPEHELPLWSVCASGGSAGFGASFILTPIELVKCKLQVQNVTPGLHAKPSGNIYTTVIKEVIAKEGIPGLWQGLSSTLVREVIGTAIWFGTYEYATSIFKKRNENGKNNDLDLVLSGALAGIVFNFSTFPADTIKSNIQTQELGPKSSGFFKVGRMLCQRPGGLKNLYNGLGITLLRAAPANAIIFYSYELLKRNIQL